MNLDRGMISRMILQQAGYEIQVDLNNQRPPELPKFGSVVVTKGYGMKVQFVFHAMLCSFLEGKDEAEKVGVACICQIFSST